MRNALLALLILLSAMLGGCTQTLAVLDGATHAKGTVHLEGYFTDSQGDVELCKVPESYTAEDAKTYCNGE
tara:strand:- start:9612 stop:9824 length:213 start_codon:yes stop_codon:yes gene_type:complete